MTEIPKQAPEGEQSQELPVNNGYLSALVRNYIAFPNDCEWLKVLGSHGLSEFARKHPGLSIKEDRIRQDLRDVLFSLLETYGFWGQILLNTGQTEQRNFYWKPFHRFQGLPDLGFEDLTHSLTNVENHTLRFYKTEDGKIVVKRVDFDDFTARGIPPAEFWMTAQRYVINPNGEITLKERFWPPTEENGQKRKPEDKLLPPPRNSLLTLKNLVTIALNGAKMQERGQFISYNKNAANGQRQITPKPKIFT